MNPNINPEAQKRDELLPKLVSDYVELPSCGLFYPNGVDKIAVEYMTASDEQYLLSENYIKNGTAFELLLKNKIKDNLFLQSMSIDDLLIGDFDAILLHLRINAYGCDYPVRVTDTNGMTYETNIDLSTLEFKPIIEPTAPDFMFNFMLPVTKKEVVFKLLTYGQRKNVNKRIEKLNSIKKENQLYELQERIIAQVHSIADETDRVFIEKYIKLMPPMDSRSLREYMLKVEPTLNYNYEFEGKFTGDFFRQTIAIGPDIFYPTT